MTDQLIANVTTSLTQGGLLNYTNEILANSTVGLILQNYTNDIIQNSALGLFLTFVVYQANIAASLTVLIAYLISQRQSINILNMLYNSVFGFLLCLVIYQADLRTSLIIFGVSLLYNAVNKPLHLILPMMMLCFMVTRKVFGLLGMDKTHMVDGMVSLALTDLPSSEIMETVILSSCSVLKFFYSATVNRILPTAAAAAIANTTTATTDLAQQEDQFMGISCCNTTLLAENALNSTKTFMIVSTVFLSALATGEDDPPKSRSKRPRAQGMDYYAPARAIVSGLYVLIEHLRMGMGVLESMLYVAFFEIGYNMNYVLRSRNVPGEGNNLITGLFMGSFFNGTGFGSMAATCMLAPSSGLVRKLYDSFMANDKTTMERVMLVLSMAPHILSYALGVFIGRVCSANAHPLLSLAVACVASLYYLLPKSKSGKALKTANTGSRKLPPNNPQRKAKQENSENPTDERQKKKEERRRAMEERRQNNLARLQKKGVGVDNELSSVQPLRTVEQVGHTRSPVTETQDLDTF